MNRRPPCHVGILAYPGCFATELFGVADLFVMADAIDARTGGMESLFTTTILGSADHVRTAGGLEVRAQPLAATVDARVDVLVVPGFEVHAPGDVATVLNELGLTIEAVRQFTGSGARVAAICVGSFLLGEAGLLSGRRATTSWLFADELQRRHPDCSVQKDSIVVSDGSVTTTAACSAAHDLALRLVRERGGDLLARRVSRVTLVADNRTSQAPYVDDSLLEMSGTALVRAAKRWLVEHLDEPYDLGRLSDAFHVSSRTMLRRFAQEATGSPLDYLQSARIEKAKQLLESPSSTIAGTMTRVGYNDPTSFRRLFVRHTGITPSAYRTNFGTREMAKPTT